MKEYPEPITDDLYLKEELKRDLNLDNTINWKEKIDEDNKQDN